MGRGGGGGERGARGDSRIGDFGEAGHHYDFADAGFCLWKADFDEAVAAPLCAHTFPSIATAAIPRAILVRPAHPYRAKLFPRFPGVDVVDILRVARLQRPGHSEHRAAAFNRENSQIFRRRAGVGSELA